MTKFTSELLFGEDNRFWNKGDGKYWFFENNNNGYYITEESNEKIKFNWKINDKGILALKIEKKLIFWKIIEADKNEFHCNEYKKANNEIVENNQFIILYDNYSEELEEEIQEKALKIREIIKSFDILDYSIFGFLFALYSFLIIISMNSIIFIKSFPLLLQFFVYSFIVFISLSKYFWISYKISIKIKSWLDSDKDLDTSIKKDKKD
jgi:hypothetical protein